MLTLIAEQALDTVSVSASPCDAYLVCADGADAVVLAVDGLVERWRTEVGATRGSWLVGAGERLCTIDRAGVVRVYALDVTSRRADTP